MWNTGTIIASGLDCKRLSLKLGSAEREVSDISSRAVDVLVFQLSKLFARVAISVAVISLKIV